MNIHDMLMVYWYTVHDNFMTFFYPNSSNLNLSNQSFINHSTTEFQAPCPKSDVLPGTLNHEQNCRRIRRRLWPPVWAPLLPPGGSMSRVEKRPHGHLLGTFWESFSLLAPWNGLCPTCEVKKETTQCVRCVGSFYHHSCLPASIL